MLDTNIQVTTAVPLPVKMKHAIVVRARRLLDRHRHCFGSALLHIYVKNANSRIGCTVNVFTDDGRYHTYVEDWDVRKAAYGAMDIIHSQIVKHFEKRAGDLREMVHT